MLDAFMPYPGFHLLLIQSIDSSERHGLCRNGDFAPWHAPGVWRIALQEQEILSLLVQPPYSPFGQGALQCVNGSFAELKMHAYELASVDPGNSELIRPPPVGAEGGRDDAEAAGLCRGKRSGR